jgi:hypothetical protein
VTSTPSNATILDSKPQLPVCLAPYAIPSLNAFTHTPSLMTTFDPKKKAANGEPAYIAVQHCLIAFAGSIPGMPVSRSKDEAQKLASDLFHRALSGEDFDAIVTEHTDDSPPGIYKMANHSFAGDQRSGVYQRGGMVPAFGDTGFPLEVGEVGLAEFHPASSPYGWHIIKRVQ